MTKCQTGPVLFILLMILLFTYHNLSHPYHHLSFRPHSTPHRLVYVSLKSLGTAAIKFYLRFFAFELNFVLWAVALKDRCLCSAIAPFASAKAAQSKTHPRQHLAGCSDLPT